MPLIAPLNHSEFARALRQGRGDVFLHAQKWGLEGMEDLVLEACLEDLTYDSQCEPDRYMWLFDLIRPSPLFEKISEGVVTALETAPLSHATNQLCELVSLIACDGNMRAATALRNFVCAQEFTPDSDYFGCHALVRLDGATAAVDMARHHAGIFSMNEKGFHENVDDLTYELGIHDEVYALLAEIAKQDDIVARYLKEYDELRARRQTAQSGTQAQRVARRTHQLRIEYPIEFILARAGTGKPSRYMLRNLGTLATPEETDLLYQRLLRESDTAAIRDLLYFFGKTALPDLPPRIWQWVHSDDWKLKHAALDALSHLQHRTVRQYALSEIEANTGRVTYGVLPLFKRNYEPGDVLLILAAINRCPDMSDDEAHDLGQDAIELVNGTHLPELAPLAEWVYDSNPCSICRMEAVKALAAMALLPERIAGECRFDALQKTREFMQAYSPSASTRPPSQ